MNVASGSGTVDVNSNGGLFGREAYVGLKGRFGTVKLGLQLDPAFISMVETDPQDAKESFSGLQTWINGSAVQNNPNTTTVNIFDANAVSYNYAAAGFSGTVLYSIGSIAGSNSANSLVSGSLSYTVGPLFLAAGAFKNHGAVAGQDGPSEWNVGGTYKLGDAKLKANYVDMKSNVTGGHDFQTYAIGGDYSFSLLTLNAGYYDNKDKTGNGKMTMFTLGGEYPLSKRTMIYLQLVAAKEDATGYGGANLVDQSGGTLSPGHTVSGAVAGIRHSF